MPTLSHCSSKQEIYPMQIALKESQLGLRNSTTRLPFRYGNVCLSSCPQAVLRVTLEVDGQLVHGYSGDCLPPGWFDKSPEKNYAQQIDDMLVISAYAQQVFLEELTHPTQFFPAWLAASSRIHDWTAGQNLTPLLASFGISLVERATIDAMARAAQLSFHQLVRKNLLEIEPSQVHRQLGPHSINQWLPRDPARSIFVRHTVGLADPLTTADIPVEERLDDGFPQSGRISYTDKHPLSENQSLQPTGKRHRTIADHCRTCRKVSR